MVKLRRKKGSKKKSEGNDEELIRSLRSFYKKAHNNKEMATASEILDTSAESASSDTSFCGHCKVFVRDGVQCDICEIWFHFDDECCNLPNLSGNTLLKSDQISYKCLACKNAQKNLKCADKSLDAMMKKLDEKMKSMESMMLRMSVMCEDEFKNTREEIAAIKKKIDVNEVDNKVTYASKVKVKNTLLIKSTENATKASDNKKEILNKIKTQVEEVKTSKKGFLVVNFADKVKLNAAKSELNMVKDDINVTVDENTKYRPKIMVCNVDDEEDDILGSIKEKNPWINDFITADEDLKLIKDNKKSKTANKKHVIIKCSPAIRKAIHLNGDKVYTTYGGSCTVYDSYRTYQCYNCREFGHSAGQCKNTLVCTKCSGNHSSGDCQESSLKCSNCVKKGYNDVCHKASDRKCPVIVEEIARIKNRTDHGF